MLSSAMQPGFVIARKWLTPAQQSWLDQVALDCACWAAQNGPVELLGDVPDDVGASFPEYASAAIGFQADAVVERKVRKRLARTLRHSLPEYSVGEPIGWFGRWGFWSLLMLVLVAVLLLIQEGRWSWISFGVYAVLPVAVVYWLVRRLGRRAARLTIHGAINEHELWFNYRAILLRISLNGQPFRKQIGDVLVIATPNGSTTNVLHQSFFQTSQAFESAVAAVGASSGDDGEHLVRKP